MHRAGRGTARRWSAPGVAQTEPAFARNGSPSGRVRRYPLQRRQPARADRLPREIPFPPPHAAVARAPRVHAVASVAPPPSELSGNERRGAKKDRRTSFPCVVRTFVSLNGEILPLPCEAFPGRTAKEKHGVRCWRVAPFPTRGELRAAREASESPACTGPQDDRLRSLLRPGRRLLSLRCRGCSGISTSSPASASMPSVAAIRRSRRRSTRPSTWTCRTWCRWTAPSSRESWPSSWSPAARKRSTASSSATPEPRPSSQPSSSPARPPSGPAFSSPSTRSTG